MKHLKKIIVFCIIFATVFGFSFTFRPQKAKAVIGVEDTTHDWIMEIENTVKQYIKDLPIDLNTAARFIVKLAVERLKDNIMRWAQGGFSDSNQPLAITQWSDFFKQAINLGSSKFLQEINATALCAPIRVSLGTALGLDNAAMMTTGIPYNQYAACSLQNVVDNVNEFLANPSISAYGWDTWTALMQPNNNVLGSFIMAEQRQTELQQGEKEAAQSQAQANNGYKNDAVCSQTDQDACMASCDAVQCEDNCVSAQDDCLATGGSTTDCQNSYKVCHAGCDCEKKCAKASIGACLNQTVKNVGSTVSQEVTTALGSDMSWLMNTTELDQLVQVLFSALTNKVINGIGSVFTPSSNSSTNNPSSNNAANTSNPSVSFENLTKSLTPQKEQELNSNVLSSTLGMIKGINRSTIACDKNSAEQVDVVENGYAEIVDQQSQSLYVNNQSVDLKPDFEVLDPLFAPLTVYGYSWDTISWKRYPAKCTDLLTSDFSTGLGQKIALGTSFNSTCADIKSGLPPISKDKNCECMFSQDGLTCPPEPYPPFPTSFDTEKNSTIIGQKQSFYNSCTATYGDVTQKCSECLKGAEQQCENKESVADKTSCVNNVCNNYGNIDGVKNGQDFYNKCSIEAQKANCYSCLKNYFMPDTYCNQIGDYVARAVIKYPGTFRNVTPWNTSDVISWLGRFDDSCGSDPTKVRMAGDKISVSTICRILPDYQYNGQSLCSTACPFTQNFTEQQLYNLNDDKPNDTDCHHQQIVTGGYSGINAVANGLLTTRGKCCKSFNTDLKNYVKCVGADEISTGPPSPPAVQICGFDHPENCCAEGWRPVALTRTGYTDTGYNPYGGDCSNYGFSSDGAHQFFLHINNGGTTSDIPFIATGGCSETDENLNNTDQLPTLAENQANGKDYIGDDLPDNPPNDTDATPPSGVIWDNQNIAPGTKAQYCMPNIPTGSYSAGVYHNDNQDTVSGIQLCEKCDSSDPGYPYYGTTLNQCQNKTDPLGVPAGCE